MSYNDDDLSQFAEQGLSLPDDGTSGSVERDGAHIWYAVYGEGPAVILLHGGLGHSGNWANQVPALVANGYQAIVVDSRGHGRSMRDDRPYMYETMAEDVRAVMDATGVQQAGLVGWSDGAVVAMILGMRYPERVAGVFFFACAMDTNGGLKEIEPSPLLDRCISRHAKDYAALSATPDQFGAFADAVNVMMATQPNYVASDLAQISVPVAVVQSFDDEFIKPEHAAYLADTIPNGSLIELHDVTHFAPIQRPEYFNGIMLAFLREVMGARR